MGGLGESMIYVSVCFFVVFLSDESPFGYKEGAGEGETGWRGGCGPAESPVVKRSSGRV